MTLLVGVGNAIGRNPTFSVGATRHRVNLFALLVGDTASGKGTAWEITRSLLERAVPDWSKQCVHYGLGSGEGLVEQVRDATEATEPVSEGDQVRGFQRVETDPGAADKRLLALETEFASLFKVMRREGNTLSPLLRSAWDGGTLEVMNRRKNALRATEAHVSVIGHITPDELRRCLDGSPEVLNGFSNRFLFALVRSTKSLPHGGDARVLDRFVRSLAEAVNKAQWFKQMNRSQEADRLWETVYDDLKRSRPSVYGKARERARAQVLRLSMLYALLDGTATISETHLRAALAIWDYCDASAREVFSPGEGGGVNNPTPTTTPLVTVLHNAILTTPGINRTGLHAAAGRNAKADELDRALEWLKAKCWAEPRTVSTGGRPGECWFPRQTEETNEETVSPPVEPSFVPVEICPEPLSPPAPTLSLAELVSTVRDRGGRFLWQHLDKQGGCRVAVDAKGTTPGIEKACQIHQAELTGLIPHRDGECDHAAYLQYCQEKQVEPTEEGFAEYMAFVAELRG